MNKSWVISKRHYICDSTSDTIFRESESRKKEDIFLEKKKKKEEDKY